MRRINKNVYSILYPEICCGLLYEASTTDLFKYLAAQQVYRQSPPTSVVVVGYGGRHNGHNQSLNYINNPVYKHFIKIAEEMLPVYNFFINSMHENDESWLDCVKGSPNKKSLETQAAGYCYHSVSVLMKEGVFTFEDLIPKLDKLIIESQNNLEENDKEYAKYKTCCYVSIKQYLEDRKKEIVEDV